MYFIIIIRKKLKGYREVEQRENKNRRTIYSLFEFKLVVYNKNFPYSFYHLVMKYSEILIFFKIRK
ncbi:hypothetical protein BEI59_22945 [Eisenbergiella tayi]|uniref:Uncharacterized protein n=1 Tax=Eisenbergiella tayi TaxID=1432052 RepID=A0A1E3UCJ7_9FIRM|nr:hypothetical protein BEI59_22945 [Eisenbergiella tayi]